MFCPECGKEVKDGAKFCNNCGKKFGAAKKEVAKEKKQAEPKKAEEKQPEAPKPEEKKPETPKPEEKKAPAAKNSKTIIILSVVVAVLILVAGGLLAWMLLNPGKSSTTDKHFSDPYDEVLYQYQVFNTYRNQVSKSNSGPGNGGYINTGSSLTFDEEHDATVNHYEKLKDKYPLLNVSDIRPDKYVKVDIDKDGTEELVICDYHNIVNVYSKDKSGKLIDFGDTFKYEKSGSTHSSKNHYWLSSDNKLFGNINNIVYIFTLKDGSLKKDKYTNMMDEGVASETVLKDVGTTEVKMTVSGTVKIMTPEERAREMGQTEHLSALRGGGKCLVICLDEPYKDVFTKSYRYTLKKTDVRTIEVGNVDYDSNMPLVQKLNAYLGQHVTLTFDASNISSANDVVGIIFEMSLPKDAVIE